MGIIEFLKGIIEVKNNDLSFLNVGDIIWARRYKTKEEKNKIQKGHQESPFVIIKKSKKKVYALQCTSNPHQEVKWKMIYYQLGRFNYQMKKNSYINCLCLYELKEIQFVEIIGHLSEYDLNQLKKQLYILVNSKFKYKPDIEKKYLDFRINVGDVILQNEDKYYIYFIDNKYYYAYRLKRRIKKNANILINNTYYSFVFDKPCKINIKSKYDLVDTFNTGEIEIINKYKERILKELSENKLVGKTLKVGSVIDYKENMYYVYEENDKEVHAYQVYSNRFFDSKMADLQVKGGIYRTFFASVSIKKEKLLSSNYKIRRCASIDEIKYNEKLHNLSFKQRIVERKKMSKFANSLNERDINAFVPMTILKNDNNENYYLVIERKDDVIKVVNINDIKDMFYFELEKENCPFEYYRILSKEEYDIYLNKIKNLEQMVSMFYK